MVGTASSGNRYSHIASHNASRPRNRGPNNQSNGFVPVQVEPVATGGFTFQRSAAVQCIAFDKMRMHADCTEREYFTKLCIEVFAAVGDMPASAPRHPLLTAMMHNTSSLSIAWIEVGQLVSYSIPTEHADQEATDQWQPYTATVTATAASKSTQKHMVQAPNADGGGHYEVCSSRSWPWKVRIVSSFEFDELHLAKDRNAEDIEDFEPEYACCVSLGKRGTHDIYTEGQVTPVSQVCLSAGIH